MGSVQEMQAQLADIRQREAEITAEMQRAKKSAKVASGDHHVAQVLHKAGVDELCPKLQKGVSRILLLMFELSSLCEDVVVSFSLGQGRQKKCRCSNLDPRSQETRQNISAGLQFLYLGVPMTSVVALDKAQEREMCMVSKYIIEYHLFHWLVLQNCEKGVTPSATQLRAEACRRVPVGCPEAVRQHLLSFFSTPGRTVRKWVLSFKRRWDVKLGLLDAGEDIEPGLLENKASQLRLCVWFCLAFLSQIWGPFLVPDFGTKNGSTLIKPCKESPKTGYRKWHQNWCPELL